MSAKKITLYSSDGEAFEVDEAVLLQSQVVKHMMEDDSGIPLLNVTSKILAKVIEYRQKHAEAVNSEDKPSKNELKAWDADFVQFYLNTLFPEDEPSKNEFKAWDADFVKVDRDMLLDLIV